MLALSFTAPGRVAHISAPGRVAHSHGRARSVSMADVKVSSNFEVTDALREYADSKLGKPLGTFGTLLNGKAELHLKVEPRGVHDAEHRGKEAHIAEITAFCIDKHVIHAKAVQEDMYASLDELTDTLARSLRKYKEKRIDVKEERKRSLKGELEDGILADDEE